MNASRRIVPRAFTLIELLVVMVIMVILISSVMVASSTLITKSKTSNTRAMLTVVHEAVEQFKREQQANPTLASSRSYRNRYGEYPPDELEVFTPFGVPGGPAGSRAPNYAAMIPAPPANGGYRPMKFYTPLSIDAPDRETVREFRDQVAMVVAIQLLGSASATILGGVQDRYWVAPLDTKGDPAVFLDRNGNGKWDAGDHQVRYIIDDWDNPISYMAQRDYAANAPTHIAASNHADWNEGASEMVRLNGGQPVIFSYGPDGAEQLTEEQMGSTAAASLLVDFEDDHIVNHPLNADNIYSIPTLKQKLAAGIAKAGP